MERNYEESALFEHQFWLKVLTDHAQFLLDALAPKEKEDIKKATYFVETFTNLLNKVRNVNLMAFSKEKSEGQAVLGRQMYAATPWLTER
ncbi:DUF2935 domain-containing protein, partial [Bacillus sp. MHSD17]|nr:DUF2935 domain-containing protein [Bacillus sp. MHSD17]